jgi:hypothetical protein
MGSAAVISIFRIKVAELKDIFEALRVSENISHRKERLLLDQSVNHNKKFYNSIHYAFGKNDGKEVDTAGRRERAEGQRDRSGERSPKTQDDLEQAELEDSGDAI